MANNTTFRNDSFPVQSTGAFRISKTLALPASGIVNADTIEVIGFPPDFKGKLIEAYLRTSATLGASATIQLRVNRGGSRTVVSAATTAGGASKVTGVAQAGLPFDLQAGDIVELLVGGADISGAATATVDLLIA